MAPLRLNSNFTVSNIVKECWPKVNFGTVYVWNGDLEEEDFRNALKQIADRDHVQDALEFLREEGKMRTSVSYVLAGKGVVGRMHFDVVDTQARGPSPYGYIASLGAHDHQGREFAYVKWDHLALK